MKGFKEIYLDYRSHPYTVTVEAYEQIKAIIEGSLICSMCSKSYTQENPMIAVNVCLSCFLQDKRAYNQLPDGFRLVSEVPTDDPHRDYKTYKFVDRKGYVYLLHTTRTLRDNLETDISQTLTHYGYRLPVTYTLKDGRTVELQDAWRRMYGDFTKSPVVLVTYQEYYGNHISTTFLLYRDREPLEFSKRKNPVRQWYLDEKAAIEATWQQGVGYIIGRGLDDEDRTAYQLFDSHLYPGIVRRATNAYYREHGVKFTIHHDNNDYNRLTAIIDSAGCWWHIETIGADTYRLETSDGELMRATLNRYGIEAI